MRSFWSYLQEHLHAEARVLHCSPEHGFRKRLESRQREYTTVDLARVESGVLERQLAQARPHIDIDPR
ncbi:MAG: hypothetical protein AAFY60_07350, partial [Myxococcota bacterium]